MRISRQGVYITAIATTMKTNSIVMTLCHDCADVIGEDKTQTIRRVDREQWVKERCDICRRPGYDYIVEEARHERT